MVRTMKATLVVALVVALLAGATNAQIITSVVRTNGQGGDRDPIGPFDGATAPLATEAGGLMDGNMVFSDRTYPWANTPAEMIGSEYVRTFNTDKSSSETDVNYAVTISQTAMVWLTCDDRIPAEWDEEQTAFT